MNWSGRVTAREQDKFMESLGTFHFEVVSIYTSATPGEMNVIKKLLENPDLEPEDQKVVLKLIDRKIGSRIRILRDSKNDCYIVGDFEPETKKLKIYSPVLDYGKSQDLDEHTQNLIKKWLNPYFGSHGNPFKAAEFVKEFKRPTKPENRFVFAIGYALCLVLSWGRADYGVDTFQLGLKKGYDDENTETMRKVIVHMLQNELHPNNYARDPLIWKNGFE